MYDESKTDTCTITVIATGIEDKINTAPTPKPAATAAGAAVNAHVAGQAVAPQPTVVHTPISPVTPLQTVVTPMQAATETVSTVNISRPAQPLTLNKPSEIKSTVEPKSLKIPDFLQRK